LRLNPPEGSGAPAWSEECLPPAVLEEIRTKLKTGELIHLECPTRIRRKTDKQPTEDKFHLYFRRTPGVTTSEIYFIRQGILVTDVRTRREAGLSGLAVIDDGALGKFLGDAENPAHTEWQSELVRQYSYNLATIKYVVESFNKILSFAKENQTAPDPLLMIDLFHEADDDEAAPKIKPKKKAGEKESQPLPPLPPPRQKWYRLQKLADGFAVLPGNGPRPESCSIRMAYDTEKGNEFKKYHPADFRLDRTDGVVVESLGFNVTEYGMNRIVADVTSDEFYMNVTGFDPNRDVVVDVRKLAVNQEQPEEEDADAEEV
jgi:hypothetical protein